MMLKAVSIFSIILLCSFSLYAQKQEDIHENEHEHEHEHEHNQEIGASVGPVYFINENEFGLSTHIHYVYNLRDSKFGLGAGYEHIFSEIKHRFVGAEINYRPIPALTLNLSPGVAFEGDQNVSKDFALHFEVSYEFELGAFHIGPVVEAAWHANEYHISAGVHFGVGF